MICGHLTTAKSKSKKGWWCEECQKGELRFKDKGGDIFISITEAPVWVNKEIKEKKPFRARSLPQGIYTVLPNKVLNQLEIHKGLSLTQLENRIRGKRNLRLSLRVLLHQGLISKTLRPTGALYYYRLRGDAEPLLYNHSEQAALRRILEFLPEPISRTALYRKLRYMASNDFTHYMDILEGWHLVRKGRAKRVYYSLIKNDASNK